MSDLKKEIEKDDSQHIKYSKISRRSFLKATAAVAGTVALAGCTTPTTSENSDLGPKLDELTKKLDELPNKITTLINNTESGMGVMPSSMLIKFDPEYCGGCITCELVCSSRHFNECNRNLSAIHVDADFYTYKFTQYGCRQCESASCVAACPPSVNAISFDTDTGARYIDMNKCTLCGACVKACPFADEKRPFIYLSKYDGKDVIIKCDLCHGYADGPACVSYCPNAALTVVK